jgi:hypothetical protein
MEFALPASSAFQRGLVAAIAHTMNTAIVSAEIANMPQHAQQTVLILSDSDFVFPVRTPGPTANTPDAADQRNQRCKVPCALTAKFCGPLV